MQQEAAEFNSGLAIIYQLDGIEKGLVEAKLERNYERYFTLLVSYFKTLYPHLRKRKEKQLERFKDMRKKWNMLNAKLIKPGIRIPLCEFEDFDDWELDLRELKQLSGLGMPEKDIRYQPPGRR